MRRKLFHFPAKFHRKSIRKLISSQNHPKIPYPLEKSHSRPHILSKSTNFQVNFGQLSPESHQSVLNRQTVRCRAEQPPIDHPVGENLFPSIILSSFPMPQHQIWPKPLPKKAEPTKPPFPMPFFVLDPTKNRIAIPLFQIFSHGQKIIKAMEPVCKTMSTVLFLTKLIRHYDFVCDCLISV